MPPILQHDGNNNHKDAGKTLLTIINYWVQYNSQCTNSRSSTSSDCHASVFGATGAGVGAGAGAGAAAGLGVAWRLAPGHGRLSKLGFLFGYPKY